MAVAAVLFVVVLTAEVVWIFAPARKVGGRASREGIGS
jgi:hypothetical protein